MNASRPLRVLIVEDSVADAELVLLALERHGFTVEHTRVDTEPGMRAALAQSTWDVVLCDYQMPRFSGLAALDVLNECALDLPVLIISGTIGEETAVLTMRRGAHDYLMKSNLTRLGSAVEREMYEAAGRRREREAKAALGAAERRFRALIERNYDGIILVLPNGKIPYASPSLNSILGYCAAEIEELTIAALVHPEDSAVLHDAIGVILSGPGHSASAEIRIKRRDGQWRWLEGCGVNLIQDPDVGAIVANFRDIDERKKLEAERARMLAQAQRHNRVKDEFLATLSHELRTPLNAIVGHASLLLDGDFEPDALEESIEAIYRNAKAQTKIIEDLLDVSRIITGKLVLAPRLIEPGTIVYAAVDAVRLAAAARNIRLDVRVAPDVAAIYGDSDRLQQVCWNLLSNAVKFSPKGGRVAVTVERRSSRLAIEVKDSGRGIDPTSLHCVFDRFWQEDASMTRRYGGLGLGLAIVRHLVELHGGTVEAESGGRDLGARFTVLLPQVAVRAAATAEGGKPGERPLPLDGVNILVVDDEPDARSLIRSVLRRSGATVTTVSDASHAYAELTASVPEVLVCDVGMPEEDGMALMRRIRALPGPAGTVAAIALTAYATDEDKRCAIAAGFDAHLAKPVEARQLVDAIVRLKATHPSTGELRGVEPKIFDGLHHA